MTETRKIGKDIYTITASGGSLFGADDFQVFKDGVMGFRTRSRVELNRFFASLHPPGNFRYPTSIKWGYDYAHGFKYITADNARHAELLIYRKSGGVIYDRKCIQIKQEDGTFRFTTPEDFT